MPRKTPEISKLPQVILHVAVSADGRIDWFSPDISQFYELASRWKEEATLAGSETILAASESATPDSETTPEPPAMDSGDPRPLLIIADSRGRVQCWQYWRTQPYWRDAICICSKATPKDFIKYLKAQQVQCVIAGEEHIDFRVALAEIQTRYNINTIRVDSGGTLNGVLLRAGLVSEISLMIHPAFVGGLSPKSFFLAPDLKSPEGVVPVELVDVEKLDGDIVWLRYRVMQ